MATAAATCTKGCRGRPPIIPMIHAVPSTTAPSSCGQNQRNGWAPPVAWAFFVLPGQHIGSLAVTQDVRQGEQEVGPFRPLQHPGAPVPPPLLPPIQVEPLPVHVAQQPHGAHPD